MGIVLGGVMLAGFFSLLDGMHQVPMGDHGMVRGFLEIPGLMVFGGGTVVLGGVLQVFRRIQVSFNALL